MKHFWFIKIHPVFNGRDENTGETIEFKNWRESILDVWATDIDKAKQTALLTGIKEGQHYNDIVEEMGSV